MAKYSNVVEYNIVTDVDTSGIVKLQNELTKLKQSLKFDKAGFSQLGFDDAKIEKSIQKVNQLQSAITAAFNPKIGTLDLSKLNTSLQKEHTSLQMIVKDWEQMGARGTMAISNLSNALLSMNKGAMNVNTTLSKIANTFGNTVRWGITASIFQEMMSSVQGAVSYMKNLDESLTQIQMVTNSSKENMRELAQYANNAAQALGSTTVDYTNAVKVFVQEGFSESESKQYANLSTKLANVSEQNTATTSDQITAYRNAFQLDYQQTVEAMDKVANVANNTASNVNELMTASQRAASVAQAVGASQDSFLASIATIESVTRQSAEEIGNGLKTIYQRFADIKVSGSTDDGVDYGQYANALKQIGVDVLNAQGEFKGMDQILKETQEVWSSLSDTMKVAVGEKVAGKFQYNRFAALMNNPEYYQKALGATQNAGGMMDQMNEYYMQGIEGRLNTLQAAGEQVISTLFNQDTIEPIIGQVTELVNGLNDMVDAAGGLTGVVQALGAIMLRTFSTQIAGTISNIATAMSTIAANSRNANQLQTTTQLVGLSNYNQTQNANSITGKLVAGVANNYNSLSDKTQERIRDLSQQIVGLEEQKTNILKEQEQYYRKINAGANEEKVLIEQRLSSLGTEIKLLRDKEKAGNITDAELDTLQTLRSERNELAKIYKQYDEIIRVCSEYNKIIAQGKPVTQEMVQQVERWKQETQGLGLNIAELIQLTEQLGIAEGNLNIGESMVNDTIQAANFEARINSVIQTLSSVTSIAFGFSMIGDAIKTLTDDSATLEEKLNAVVMNGLMGLTMLLPGLTSLATQMKALTVEFVVNTLAVDANTASEVLNTMSLKDRIVMTAAATVELIKNTAATLASAAADAVKAVAAAAAAHPIAAIAIALGAVTIGLAAATKAWIDNYGEVAQATKEYEKQNELLTETKQNYQDLQEKVDSLKRSLNSISKTTTSLRDLTKGTKEWKESVRQLNQEVLGLLQTYPELAKYVKNENGMLNLDEAGAEKFYQEQIDKASHLNDINSVQQAKTLQAKNNVSIAEFAVKNGISKEEVETAIQEGAAQLEGRSAELNVAFAKLQNTIQANNLTIDTLNESVGALNNSFTDYSTKETVDNNAAKTALTEKFGVRTYDEYGSETGITLDFSMFANNQELWDMVTKAIGKQVVGAEETGVFGLGDGIKFKTADGGEQEYSSEQLLELLSTSEAALDAVNSKLQENIDIYTAFGARYDEANNQFVDSTGKVITSLEDLKLSGDQLAAIDAYRKGTYNEVAKKEQQFSGSIGEFAEAIKSTTIDVTGFKDALLINDVQKKTQSKFTDLENKSQTEGVAYTADAETFNGLVTSSITERIKLKPEQAKEIMSDMMKKLNESQLSNEDKLQLMDKIDWTMPVEDILANIQHAIDSNNINTAFTNTIGLEDDSERKAKVLEGDSKKEKIEESTFEAYQEQIEQTDNLANRKRELVDALNETKAKFGEESEQAEDAQKELDSFADESSDLTVDLIQTQRGLEKLSTAMYDYGDILRNADQSTLEYAEALGTVKQAMADVLNVDVGSLSNNFIQNSLEDIEALAQGDVEALDRLRAAAGQDIAMSFYLDGNLNEDELQLLEDKALEISSLDIEMGASVDDDAFIESLNQMLEQGKLTKDQVNEYLQSIGVEPNFTTKKVETTVFETPGFSVPIGIPGVGSIPFELGAFAVKGKVEVPQISTKKSGGASGGGSGQSGLIKKSSSTGTNSGISKNYVDKNYAKDNEKAAKDANKKEKNNQKKDKQTSEWDYLTDITNDLDRAAAAMEKLSKLEDRLFGKNRISQLKKLQGEYQNYIKLLQKENKLAKQHAKTLRENAYDENGNLTINGYAYRAGVSQLQFDAQGNLENGKQIEQLLLNKVNQATDEYNKHRNDEDTGQYEWNLDQAKKDYDGFLKAMSDYESTLSKIEDGQNAAQEYKEKIQDAADAVVDAIQEGLDNVIKAIDNQRDFNKLYRDWQEGGSSYSHFDNDRMYYTEGLEGLLSTNSSGGSVFDAQLTNLADRIKDVEDVFDVNGKDNIGADDEKLSQQAAFENLQQATSKALESLQQMTNYYDSLLETIKDASNKMDDLIDDRLNEFNRLEDYLDTRLDQLQLLFGDKSYEEQTEFYNQKIEANMEKMVSINAAIEAKQATVEALEKLEASNKTLSTEERQELQSARDKINELQEEQLATESKLLKDIADKLRTQTTAEMDNLVKNLFNGADVSWLSEQWELATRNSEKYLDDYNRAFELQKLQLKFQDALNDNQNASLATQQKINALADEYLTYLREKENLSEYDVKHAQMQLEILQKQIALEDARNNKSQMRLQRNAAGNYDFVYAADEDAVNQANQALLAAQQEAYNLSKQMYLETYESAFQAAQKTKDMIVSIATDASLSVEERTERIKFVLDNLNEYLGESSIELGEISVNLYNSFIEAEQLISEENLENLTSIFELMREQSGLTRDAVQTDLENTNEIANETWNNLATSITDEDGYLSKIKLGTFNTMEGISAEVLKAISQIDERFGLSKDFILQTTAEIDSSISVAYNNIIKSDGYLDQYKKKNQETLRVAQDDYQNFTKNSIEYANTQLQGLRGTTEAWKQDLSQLNTTINLSSEQMKNWKTKIDKAIDSAKDLINKSNTMQQNFGAIAAGSAISSSTLNQFASGAKNAGSSVKAMANQISGSYSALKNAAKAATDAYNKMTEAANRAREAADLATNSVNNIPSSTSNGVDTSGLINSVKDAISNMFSNFSFSGSGGGKFGNNDYNNIWFDAGGNWAYYDSGGYTGTWSDPGIGSKNGKLAVLHQKELILNEKDTKNMLSAVEVVRDIMSGINNLPSLGKVITQNDTNADTIEQRVEINATFPGVTEAIEIKQALEQLADNAYQVANKYRY